MADTPETRNAKHYSTKTGMSDYGVERYGGVRPCVGVWSGAMYCEVRCCSVRYCVVWCWLKLYGLVLACMPLICAHLLSLCIDGETLQLAVIFEVG